MGVGERWRGAGIKERMGREKVPLPLTPPPQHLAAGAGGDPPRFAKGLRPRAGAAPRGGQRSGAVPGRVPSPHRPRAAPQCRRRCRAAPSPALRGGQRAAAPGRRDPGPGKGRGSGPPTALEPGVGSGESGTPCVCGGGDLAAPLRRAGAPGGSGGGAGGPRSGGGAGAGMLRPKAKRPAARGEQPAGGSCGVPGLCAGGG